MLKLVPTHAASWLDSREMPSAFRARSVTGIVAAVLEVLKVLAITSKDFWEVVDRGTNFDYLSDERKQKLREFFAEFASLAAPAAE